MIIRHSLLETNVAWKPLHRPLRNVDLGMRSQRVEHRSLTVGYGTVNHEYIFTLRVAIVCVYVSDFYYIGDAHSKRSVIASFMSGHTYKERDNGQGEDVLSPNHSPAWQGFVVVRSSYCSNGRRRTLKEWLRRWDDDKCKIVIDIGSTGGVFPCAWNIQ